MKRVEGSWRKREESNCALYFCYLLHSSGATRSFPLVPPSPANTAPGTHAKVLEITLPQQMLLFYGANQAAAKVHRHDGHHLRMYPTAD